jgi:hypothetical protein
MCVSGVLANDPQPGTCCSRPHPAVEQLALPSREVTAARKIDAHDDFNARVARILTLSVFIPTVSAAVTLLATAACQQMLVQ